MFERPTAPRAASPRPLPPVSPEIITRIADPLDLNPQQLTVVTAKPGPTLVMAGAGSGKTKVLTRRAGWLIAQGIHPKRILLITFTRKAAAEMLRRVQDLNPYPTLKIQGGTFHSMAHAWLRQHGQAIGLTARFVLMDEADTGHLLHLLASKQHLTGQKGFPEKRTLLSLFGQAANSLLPVPQIVERDFPQYSPHTDAIAALHRLFVQTKLTQQRFDYDDLLLLLHRLFHEQPTVGACISGAYDAVLVDEYQDTTRLQAALVRCLTQPHNNVMVVGDPHQSIYSFRAADVRNMQEFVHLFEQPAIYKLEQNYRSSQHILRIANRLIPSSAALPQPTLFTTNGPGPHPQLVRCSDEHRQSLYLIDQIRAMQHRGVGLHRMAVLVRLSAHSYDLETALTHQRIPYLKYGGLALVETAHVKDFLAYVTVLQRPYDRLAWQRLLLLFDGIGPSTAEQLIQTMAHQPDPLSILTTTPGPALTERHTLASLLRQVQGDTGPLPDRLARLLDHYLPILQRHYPEDAHERINELTNLVRYHHDVDSLATFVEHLTMTGASDHSQTPDHPAETLVLSTIHSAKGLEWDVVFVINVSDGKLPYSRARLSPATLDEERRLLYVAVTRARHALYLTYATQGSNGYFAGQTEACCRFLDALDEHDLERVSVP